MEIELKYALENKQQYKTILDFLNHKSGKAALVLEQENIFFDTKNGHLRTSGLILRLRQENGSYWLTAKGSSATEPLQETILSARLEEEIALEPAQAKKLLEGHLDPVKLFEESDWPSEPEKQKERLLMLGALIKARHNQTLNVIGKFRNTRRMYTVAIQQALYKVECDETFFPGNKTDFEIEIELPNEPTAHAVRDEVEKWLRSMEIPIATTSGKAARFFASMKKD